MTNSSCSSKNSIIELYTELARHPDKDFGWAKGLSNALQHGYSREWIELIPQSVWQYCAAVGNPFVPGDFDPGSSVLDLGCGAGVDLCVASLLVGNEGRVVGVDITPAMVELAHHNVSLTGRHNVEVLQGSIEQLPFDECFDIVISNGAINLSTDKEKVFEEIYRVLVPGGHLYFADMIKVESYTEESCQVKESWADCVAGTLKSDDLVRLIESAGFVDVKRVSLTSYKTSDSTIGAVFRAGKGS